MAKGIDSDVDCTATAQLIKGAGYDFVGRYYRMPSPYSGKTPLKRSEAAALTTQGLSIVSIWEYISGSRNRIETLTYETGKDEGKRAYSQALAFPRQQVRRSIFVWTRDTIPTSRRMRVRLRRTSRA